MWSADLSGPQGRRKNTCWIVHTGGVCLPHTSQGLPRTEMVSIFALILYLFKRKLFKTITVWTVGTCYCIIPYDTAYISKVAYFSLKYLVMILAYPKLLLDPLLDVPMKHKNVFSVLGCHYSYNFK